ncbi:MAG: tetratricopeptide repeat protein [Cyanobacteria bacterium SZAS TMP-1]|nr:tetratricopeptide repeat protein [Cyanobacteria bacterium SZAS TMP-1]
MNLPITKPGLPIALAISLTVGLTLSAPTAAAAAKARHRGGGGGVYLTTPNPTNPLEHNNRGVELGQKGLWPQAIEEAKIALEGDPDNDIFKKNLSGAQLQYGSSLAARKNYPEAIKQFRDALFTDPENGPAENGLNRCLTALGKSPGDLSYRLSLGAGAEGQGLYSIAAVEYRVCTHIQDSGVNNYKLGRALLKAGKPVEGYDTLRTALRKDWSKDEQDQLVECHLLLADTLLNFAYITKKQGNTAIFIKRLNNAMIEYKRAATINPSNMAAVHGLTETTREAVTLQPSFANLLALGSAYLLQFDFDRAKINFEKAWRLNPSSPDLARARLAFHGAVVDTPTGVVNPMRVAESVQKVEDLLAKNPNDTDLLYIVAKGKSRIGDTAGALDACERGLKIKKYDERLNRLMQQLRGGGDGAVAAAGGGPVVPGAGPGAAPGSTGGGGVIPPGGTPGGAPGGGPGPGAAQPAAAKNAAAYSNIEGLIKSNQYDAAATAADAILAATPADGQAWNLKGICLEKKGDLDEAAVCYRQASGLKIKEADDSLKRINDMRIKPLMEQAEALIVKNDLPGAAEILNQATSMSPRDAALWRKLGEVLKKNGDEKGAERALRKADEAAKAK